MRNQANGTARIYVVSDDNYNPLQRTLLLAFTLEAATSILDSNNPRATRSPTAPVR